jgi:hypothetical protein
MLGQSVQKWGPSGPCKEDQNQEGNRELLAKRVEEEEM